MKVFISHASTDAKLARRVADVLREASIQVWDDTQPLSGANRDESIGKALDESSAMIVLLTPDSVHSPDIADHVGYALGNRAYKGRVIPVVAAPSEQLDIDEIPWILKKFNVIHMSSSEEEEGLKEITRALEASN